MSKILRCRQDEPMDHLVRNAEDWMDGATITNRKRGRAAYIPRMTPAGVCLLLRSLRSRMLF
jgi:hypothetical protein